MGWQWCVGAHVDNFGYSTSADFLNKLYLKRPKLSIGAWAGNGAQGHLWTTLDTPCGYLKASGI